MNLHEYQAKQLFARYGLPAPVGYACTTPREAEEAASKIGVGAKAAAGYYLAK
ncbi:ATP-grasp domain-containing protein, partial [Klebsiella pneumoniae]